MAGDEQRDEKFSVRAVPDEVGFWGPKATFFLWRIVPLSNRFEELRVRSDAYLPTPRTEVSAVRTVCQVRRWVCNHQDWCGTHARVWRQPSQEGAGTGFLSACVE